jgi:hypothetical protein
MGQAPTSRAGIFDFGFSIFDWEANAENWKGEDLSEKTGGRRPGCRCTCGAAGLGLREIENRESKIENHFGDLC